MTAPATLATVLDRAGEELGGFLPRLGGALLLLVVGILAARLICRFLKSALNQAVLFLPKALAAMGLLLAGVVLGGMARQRVDHLSRQMDSPVPLGKVAQGAVVAVFAITAAAQIAVSTAILMALVGVLLAGVMATLALAFGSGGRALAAQMSAGRYVGGAFELGQHIAVGEASGEVVALETAATVLRAADGSTLRVPNSMLLESVVRVRPAPGAAPSE